MEKIERREFLERGITTLVFLPLVGLSACNLGKAPYLSPEESLKKLILLLGPWRREDNEIAQNYITRFMQTESGLKKYLPASGRIIQDLASNFPDDELEINEIQLDRLTSEEREIILNLTKQIYDFVEVQFYASHMPPWGQCIADPMWHTRAPV